jgi:hypothetical protein
VATGGLPEILIRRAVSAGVPKEKMTDLGGERPPAEVYERVLELCREKTLVFATGNTVGYGDSLIAYFAQRGQG